MIERQTGLNVQQDRAYLLAESESHAKLVAEGFQPQGCTRNFKQVVVFELLDGHEHGRKEVYYFRNWQEAAETLCS